MSDVVVSRTGLGYYLQRSEQAGIVEDQISRVTKASTNDR